ncbi:hypothetical protein HOLleu_39749 [Holothuria leucospilota]|uniref:Uncharacterized protein n=1 Tax=Holothuria leucospilota TaxID=206669 RepID=A0A9Q0YGT8_HOLLE|nr:hypothetical protein HOLleu_39749 [Holothuria leucospilota]
MEYSQFRQLMEIAREQLRSLYKAFVEFIKVFDSVNGDILFIILGKLGCPLRFIKMIKMLYTNLHAELIVDGELTQAFECNCGVKVVNWH